MDRVGVTEAANVGLLEVVGRSEGGKDGAVDNVGTTLGARVGLVDTLGLSVGPVHQEIETRVSKYTSKIQPKNKAIHHTTLCKSNPLPANHKTYSR